MRAKAPILLAAFFSFIPGLFGGDPPILPDRRLSPGDALDVTVKDISAPGYTKKVRDVPAAVKRQVFAEYGIPYHGPHEFEVDHLIPLEIGGSNSIKNLWPESYLTQPWNARVKDVLENRLHKLVCNGQLDLNKAQQAIATNWIEAYKKYVGPEPSPKSTPSSQPLAPGGIPAAANAVWVNTRSGVYWEPGTEYYGKTKQGEFMTEAEAISDGYHAAGGR